MATVESLDAINTKLAKTVGFTDKIDKATKNITANLAKVKGGLGNMTGGSGPSTGGSSGGSGLGLGGFSSGPAAASGGSGGGGSTTVTQSSSYSSSGGAPGGGNGNLMAGALGVVGSAATAAWNMTPGVRDYAASQAALFPTAFGMAGSYSNTRAAAAIRAGIGQGSSGAFDAKAAAAMGSNSGLSFNLGNASGGTALGNALGAASFSYQMMGMSNQAAMAGQIGMTKGTSGVSSALAKIGIFTVDMNSGKRKDMGQIVDDLWARFYGSKSAKITMEQFDADLSMGFLGADLQTMFGSQPELYAQIVAFMQVKAKAGGRAGMLAGAKTGANSVAQVAKGLGMTEFNTPTVKAGEVNSARNATVDMGSAAGMQGYVTASDAVVNVNKGMQALAETLPDVVNGLTTMKTFLDTFGSSSEGGSIMGFVGGLLSKLPGLAGGGMGTSTSDSIPARLSKGEYVINARAAQQIGRGNLDALNSGGHAFGSGYASPVKSFANGGTTISGNPVDSASDLGTFGIPGGNIRVDKSVGGLFQQLFSAWQANSVLGGGRLNLLKGAAPQSYAVRQARAASGTSDHAGWAVDMRTDILRADNKRHMTAAENAAVHQILSQFGGKIGWGGDYQTLVDEMHFYYKGGAGGGSSYKGTPAADAGSASTGTESTSKILSSASASRTGLPVGITSNTYASIMGTSLAGMGKAGSAIGSFSSGYISASSVGNNAATLVASMASGAGSSGSGVQGVELLAGSSPSATAAGSAANASSGGATPTATPKGTLASWLSAAGFRGEHLREAWAIAMRESGGHPQSHNTNRSTGDDSYGLFQINMLGKLGPDRDAKFRKYVPGYHDRKDLLDPLINAKAAAYMSQKGNNWSNWRSAHYGKADYYYDQYAKSASHGMASTHAGVVNVHEGEMIMPAAEAQQFRGMLQEVLSGGGGRGRGDVNIVLHIDRASDEEARKFAKQVKRIMEDDARVERLGNR